MPTVQLTARLRDEYARLFNECAIRSDRVPEIETVIKTINKNRQRYDTVHRAIGIPWYVVAVIHSMEASQDFTKHLHNGDPLTARTIHVPQGRPRLSEPPFTWEESAADALTLKKLGSGTDWSLSGTLYCLEGYNGWGYRLFHPEIMSPYLWSFSNQYDRGKYIADGTWSSSAVSKQCGAAVILRRMAEKLLIEFPDQPLPREDSDPLVVTYSNRKSRDPVVVTRAVALQRWLSGFAGIFVKIDGIPGERTSEAYRKVTGHFLPGDPRS